MYPILGVLGIEDYGVSQQEHALAGRHNLSRLLAGLLASGFIQNMVRHHVTVLGVYRCHKQIRLE